MQIFPLSEGAFTIDKTKVFVPFDTQQDELQARTTGSLLVEVQPFLVVTNNDIILLDTGLGFSTNGQLQIHQTIAKLGFQQGDVSKVLMSHLHKDHAGGIATKTVNGKYEMAFSNATYYVQQAEFDFAMQTGFPSYIPEEIEILHNHSQVKWLRGNGSIDGFVNYEITNAHCPQHQVFWLKENNETIFFGGDDAPQLQQMKTRYIAKYDFDGKKAMQLRQDWWQKGNTENWKFLFYHDIKVPMFG